MEDTAYLEILRAEFDAEEGSFLLTLRIAHEWDTAAFTRLTEAMRLCCERQGDGDLLERWLVVGFWFLATFVRDMSQHPNFPRPYDAAYYERAYERLWALADWYIRGYSPYLPGKGFEPL